MMFVQICIVLSQKEQQAGTCLAVFCTIFIYCNATASESQYIGSDIFPARIDAGAEDPAGQLG